MSTKKIVELKNAKAIENKFYKLIVDVEDDNNIPSRLLLELLRQESSFIPKYVYATEVSSAGAVGIAQLLPKYHPDQRIWNEPVDPKIPEQAIPYAGKYLKFLFNQFDDWTIALAAYNWGETRVRRNRYRALSSYPDETQNYVIKISDATPISGFLHVS